MASVKKEYEALKSELQRTKEKLQKQTEESQNLQGHQTASFGKYLFGGG